MQENRVIIFDTTLRDGEQCPGASMNLKEKLEVARQLARLRVDVMEAGFPICSPGDWEAVHTIAQEIDGPTIAGLARAQEKDIEAAGTAIEPARKRRIHTFIATSPIHMEKKLKKTAAEVVEMAVRSVSLARSFTDDVEWSAEDAGRTDLEFLVEIVTAVVEAGATTINIPDTVGYQVPSQYGRIFATLRERVPGIEKCVLSTHCHNDLGLAVANSLAALENGARQVECTINGIGERAGNCSLEEIVMALKVRRDRYGLETGIRTEEIYRSSRLVSSLTGLPVQPNKAIVGRNAFAHEAGIHQDGILKHSQTYEIMTPQDVGVPSSQLVLGKHSGRHAFRKRLEELGYDLSDEEIGKAFERFKKLADKKKEIYDEDLEAIVEDEIYQAGEFLTLEYLQVTAGNRTVATATIQLGREGDIKEEAATGDGPVDATYKAINRLVPIEAELTDYSIKAITRGRDALGEVSVTLKINGRRVAGRAAATDIIEASARAYLNAVNRFLAQEKRAGKDIPAFGEKLPGV
ncbi:MAG: 2-isopropylmalate synthase [Candidatus Hydrogenedentota bacterium]|nr:MAG: 2-isopropylmalate synthase [Candidatus Hydrogenedentota bacterium]